MAKVSIDRDGCISCGICWNTCPAVYEQNPDDSKSQLVSALQENGSLGEGNIDAALEECAKQGAAACPMSVITVD